MRRNAGMPASPGINPDSNLAWVAASGSGEFSRIFFDWMFDTGRTIRFFSFSDTINLIPYAK
jgi:hypothetical protein